jgi:hypothetical protein
VSTFSLIVPLIRVVAAQWWRTVPCTIVTSRVLAGPKDAENYGFEIAYQYEIEEQKRTSSRYSFSAYTYGATPHSRFRIVDLHQEGHRSTCYVNPRNPADAVLERTLTADYFYGLIPLGLTAGGLAVLVRLVKRRRSAA